MCLQFCHVTRQLIDNDIPCHHCPDVIRFAHVGHRCEGCKHYHPREGKKALCDLTKMPIPLGRTCCHWNVNIEQTGILRITEDMVAPGLMAWRLASTVRELFDLSETAPEYEVDERGSVVVPLEDLALPDVYGLDATQWDDALGLSVDEYWYYYGWDQQEQTEEEE